MSITLKSGRVLELIGAGLDTIGIGSDLAVHEGYDNGIREWDREDDHGLTTAERVELCEIMIDRWSRLRGSTTHGIVVVPCLPGHYDWRQMPAGGLPDECVILPPRRQINDLCPSWRPRTLALGRNSGRFIMIGTLGAFRSRS